MEKNKYYSHILAWFYMTGQWPTNKIDHIDCNISNNRFNNLRETCNSKNGLNRLSNLDRGVAFTASGMWRATIRFDGKPRQIIGHYKERREAILAFRNAYYEVMDGCPSGYFCISNVTYFTEDSSCYNDETVLSHGVQK